MDEAPIPPEFEAVDERIRMLVESASDSVSPEHLLRIHRVLQSESDPGVARRDWWFVAGTCGAVTLAVVGPTGPAVAALTFGVGLGWARALGWVHDEPATAVVPSPGR